MQATRLKINEARDFNQRAEAMLKRAEELAAQAAAQVDPAERARIEALASELATNALDLSLIARRIVAER